MHVGVDIDVKFIFPSLALWCFHGMISFPWLLWGHAVLVKGTSDVQCRCGCGYPNLHRGSTRLKPPDSACEVTLPRPPSLRTEGISSSTWAFCFLIVPSEDSGGKRTDEEVTQSFLKLSQNCHKSCWSLLSFSSLVHPRGTFSCWWSFPEKGDRRRQQMEIWGTLLKSKHLWDSAATGDRAP